MKELKWCYIPVAFSFVALVDCFQNLKTDVRISLQASKHPQSRNLFVDESSFHCPELECQTEPHHYFASITFEHVV